MPVFRFKYFDVQNERSAMKVNTDGVLLGALMTVRPGDTRLLDIGTGTGTVALMAAQRHKPPRMDFIAFIVFGDIMDFICLCYHLPLPRYRPSGPA